MRAIMRAILLAILTLITGCSAPMGEAPGTRAPGYRGSELRRPALTVRLELGPERASADRS